MAIYLWQNFTSPELSELIKQSGSRAVGLLSFGALEQHGPHLPLSTDNLIAACLQKHVLDHATQYSDVFVLPHMPLGASREHNSFTGTVAIQGSVFMEMAVDMARALKRSGLNKVILLSSHGGNNHWLAEAALTLRSEEGMMVVPTSWNRLLAPITELPEDEIKHGIHGGALETALVRYLSPNEVREDKVRAFPRKDALAKLMAGGACGYAWMAEDINAQGVVGSADMGTESIGKALSLRASLALIALADNLAQTEL